MTEFKDYTKPPLGASPAYIPAENRIKELAEAITRTSIEGRNYTGHISMWAREIIMQCEIMEKIK
jgi:ribulose 1,5-bisphosphate carboxylase large subunit-like protein